MPETAAIHPQSEDSEAKSIARKLAALDAVVLGMQPGVLPHIHPFSRLAKRVGLTREQFDAWAKTVPNWDPLVSDRHSNAYDRG